MDEDRRGKKRRRGDHVLQRTIEVLEKLEKISEGNIEDFTEHYADLVGVKDLVGRRKRDRTVGELLCSTIESLATNLDTLLQQDQSLRKVRITKMRGKKTSRVAVHTSVVGWEAEQPSVGDRYQLYKDGGGIFRSAVVTEVKSEYFKTKNSTYRIEVLDQN